VFDFTGHLTGKHESHRTLSACPLYHNTTAEECKVIWCAVLYMTCLTLGLSKGSVDSVLCFFKGIFHS